jgi:hypothetical protein
VKASEELFVSFSARCRLLPGLPDFPSRNVPKLGEMYQIATNLPNGHKSTKIYGRNIFQIIYLHRYMHMHNVHMAKYYTNLFHSKALQNLPKLVLFLIWNYAIWQPCLLHLFLNRWLCRSSEFDLSILCPAKGKKNWRFSQKPMLWSTFCII